MAGSQGAPDKAVELSPLKQPQTPSSSGKSERENAGASAGEANAGASDSSEAWQVRFTKCLTPPVRMSAVVSTSWLIVVADREHLCSVVALLARML